MLLGLNYCSAQQFLRNCMDGELGGVGEGLCFWWMSFMLYYRIQYTGNNARRRGMAATMMTMGKPLTWMDVWAVLC